MIVKETLKLLKTALMLLLLLSLITGFIYPSMITGLAQLLFPWQANGSLIKQHDKAIGSSLIGQSFNSPQYFWGRPSATTPYAYNAGSSSGSNLGPSNPDFLATIKNRVEHLQKSDPRHQRLIPVDLVTASGSGLDPDISPLAALYQVPRIAKARGLSESEVDKLIQHLINNRTLGILGEPYVNVLELNLALDDLQHRQGSYDNSTTP